MMNIKFNEDRDEAAALVEFQLRKSGTSSFQSAFGIGFFKTGADFGYACGQASRDAEVVQCRHDYSDFKFSAAEQIAKLQQEIDGLREVIQDAIDNIYGNDMHINEIERRLRKALAQFDR